MSTHTIEYRYRCERCDKGYTHSYSLKKHTVVWKVALSKKTEYLSVNLNLDICIIYILICTFKTCNIKMK